MSMIEQRVMLMVMVMQLRDYHHHCLLRYVRHQLLSVCSSIPNSVSSSSISTSELVLLSVVRQCVAVGGIILSELQL
jgi:hypothetical protein